MKNIESHHHEFSGQPDKPSSPDAFLLSSLVENIENACVVPTINQHKLIDFFSIAKNTNKPLICIAVGCQDWVKPSWGDPAKDRLIRRIEKTDKRSKRFASEIAGFQKALDSFGIQTKILFSLSNIEAFLHLELGQMGLEIHNIDARDNLRRSPETIKALIHENGGWVEEFDHLSLAQNIIGTSSPIQIQEAISGKSHPSMRDFLDGLYNFDLTHLPQIFEDNEGVGPIWLDIQSFSFEADAKNFRNISRTAAPELPILAPFRNAGDWHGAPSPESKFATILDTISDALGMQPRAATKEEWLRRIQRIPDSHLINILGHCGIQTAISSRQEQVHAISLIARHFMNWDIPTI